MTKSKVVFFQWNFWWSCNLMCRSLNWFSFIQWIRHTHHLWPLWSLELLGGVSQPPPRVSASPLTDPSPCSPSVFYSFCIGTAHSQNASLWRLSCSLWLISFYIFADWGLSCDVGERAGMLTTALSIWFFISVNDTWVNDIFVFCVCFFQSALFTLCFKFYLLRSHRIHFSQMITYEFILPLWSFSLVHPNTSCCSWFSCFMYFDVTIRINLWPLFVQFNLSCLYKKHGVVAIMLKFQVTMSLWGLAVPGIVTANVRVHKFESLTAAGRAQAGSGRGSRITRFKKPSSSYSGVILLPKAPLLPASLKLPLVRFSLPFNSALPWEVC